MTWEDTIKMRDSKTGYQATQIISFARNDLKIRGKILVNILRHALAEVEKEL